MRVTDVGFKQADHYIIGTGDSMWAYIPSPGKQPRWAFCKPFYKCPYSLRVA